MILVNGVWTNLQIFASQYTKSIHKGKKNLKQIKNKLLSAYFILKVFLPF